MPTPSPLSPLTADRATWRRVRVLLALGALGVGLALYAAAGGAATPAKPATTSSGSKPVPFKPSATAEQSLTGVWRSQGTPDFKELPGMITLQSDRVAIVAPDMHLPLVGTWHASRQELRVTVPDHGEAHMPYTLDSTRQFLVVRYEDGTTQTYQRLHPHPKAS